MRALRGGVWLGAGGAAEQGLRLLRNMILARVLAPESFGLMAIILAVTAAFESFTQIGIREAIIQYPQAEDRTYLNGAWWLSFGRSAGLTVLGVFGSFWIADFYHITPDVRLLQASFLSILFNGALSAGAYIAVKKMEYRKWAFISHGGGIIGILTAIILSFLLHDVTALVIGFITEAAARCILSFMLCPYLPRFHFAEEHLKALFSYARGMFGLPILYFVYAQIPIFVLGKMLSQKEIGFYSMAASLAQAPATFITTLMNQILMPAFSTKQADKTWINQTILKFTKIIVLIGIPISVFAALYGREVLAVIYGAPYSEVALPFALLLAATLLSTFSIPIVNVYLAIGVPHLHRYFSAVRAVLIVLLIYPAIRLLGATGAALAVFVSMAVSYVFQVGRMRALTRLDTVQYGLAFVQGAFVSLVILGVWYATYNVLSRDALRNLVYGLTGSMLVYGLLAALYFHFHKSRKVASKESVV